MFDAEQTGRIDLHELKVRTMPCPSLCASTHAGQWPLSLTSHLRPPTPGPPTQVLMRALGFPVKKQQVLKLAGEVAPNHGGTVDFQTYLEISALVCVWGGLCAEMDEWMDGRKSPWNGVRRRFIILKNSPRATKNALPNRRIIPQ